MSTPAKARAQQDWRNGLSLDENPYPKNTLQYFDYALEHHRLEYEEFARDCLAPA